MWYRSGPGIGIFKQGEDPFGTPPPPPPVPPAPPAPPAAPAPAAAPAAAPATAAAGSRSGPPHWITQQWYRFAKPEYIAPVPTPTLPTTAPVDSATQTGARLTMAALAAIVVGII